MRASTPTDGGCIHPHTPARAVFALALGVLAAARASADDFDTDRPDFTNGTALVPVRHVQVELGWTEDRYTSGHRDDTFGESLVRIGLGSRAELRASGPDWDQSRDPGLFEDGPSATSVGAKVALSTPGAPRTAALILALGLPGGAGSFAREGFDAAATLAGEWDGDHAGVSSNFTLSREGDGEQRMWSGALTLSFEHDLVSRWSGFLEWYEVLDDTDHRPDFVDAGLLWQPAHWTQLDARVGRRIDRGEGHTFFGAGVSRRFGAWARAGSLK
jgi:hypothetical protein